jgi:hypothetical protein
MQNVNFEYGERRCGFNTKHQSTKAPMQVENESANDVAELFVEAKLQE